MGYRIKELKEKKKPPFWKVQFVSYKEADCLQSKAKKKSKTKDVPKTDWHAHGFRFDMTYEEAKRLADMKNAKSEEKRWAEKKVKIRERLDDDDRVINAHLNPSFVEEFEQRVLRRRLARGNDEILEKNKLESHWRAARIAIVDLRIEPTEWSEEATVIYDYFKEKKFSPSYVQKILRLMNQWGFFICKKEMKPFLPIPAPRGREYSRIADSFFDKYEDGRASKPLTPSMLEKEYENLHEANYTWLFISIQFGLRPHEVDSLKKDKFHKIHRKDGNRVLSIYQPKLLQLPKEQRWKHIPILEKDQDTALFLIKGKQFRRPTYKTMRTRFGERVTLYGGRKGFTDRMLDLGYELENIAQWMGHTSIERTWKNYKDKAHVNQAKKKRVS